MLSPPVPPGAASPRLAMNGIREDDGLDIRKSSSSNLN
jgi:hypothetical protein